MRSRFAWRRWGLVTLVNCSAAIAAVLAFGAWQRFETSRGVLTSTPKTPGFYELADDVGYIPKANARATVRAEADGQTVYDVDYTTGPDHFRTVPEPLGNPDACVLAFGASFTFGDGVRDDETYPAQIVSLSGGHVAAQNFAVSGWGLHQFLAGLQSGRFQRAVRCKPTDAVLVMIPSLIWRTSGVGNPWDNNGPRFRLGADGRPVRAGKFSDPDPYNWRRWVGLTPVSKGDAIALAKVVVVAAFGELRHSYPDIRTHLILYRVASWTDVGLNLDDLVSFEYDLHQAGATPIPLEAIMPRYRFEQRDYVLHPTDMHPNPRAYRLIADFVLRQVNPSLRGENRH